MECWVQVACAADHTVDVGKQGDPRALGAGECVWMQRRQQHALRGRSVIKRGKALHHVLPTGKVHELCLERGISPLRNPEVV